MVPQKKIESRMEMTTDLRKKHEPDKALLSVGRLDQALMVRPPSTQMT